jgi:hypothetical protein
MDTNTNQRRILDMVAEQKISAEEAERLLKLVGTEAGAESPATPKTRTRPKYLRVEIRPTPQNVNAKPDNVNIRVPITLLRSGMKFASLIPKDTYEEVNSALKDKGMQFDLRNLKAEDIDELIEALNDLEIDINDGMQTVKVFTE